MPWTSDQLPWTFQYTPPAKPSGQFSPLNWMKGPPILTSGGAVGNPGGPGVLIRGGASRIPSGPPVMLGGRIPSSPGGAPVMLGTGGRPDTYGAPTVLSASPVRLYGAPSALVGIRLRGGSKK